MKINPIIYDPSSVNGFKKNDPNGNGLDFKTLLKNAEIRVEGEIQKVSSPFSVTSLSTPFNELEDINHIRSLGIKTSEGVLHLLEEYHKAIINDQIPLEKIDPLIQSLSREVSRLQILSERIPESDPLRKILTELGVISAVEVEKYYRERY